MHVNDVGTDTVQKVLGMGDEDQDALETAKPKNQSGRCSKAEDRRAERQTQKTFLTSHPYT